MIKADLHIHTQASDGSETPESVIAQAKHVGLEMIAITDHDVTDSVQRAEKLGKEADVVVVPGIEFSTAHESELHILGYFLDISHPKIKAYTQNARQARQRRVEEYINVLKKSGISLDLDHVLSLADGGMLSRVHLAKAMHQQGHVESITQAFKQYLGRNAKTYIDKEKIATKACIELIAECGGLSVWAHPVYQMGEKFDDLLDELLIYGLNGLEVYHPDHSDSVAKQLDRLAQKKAMLETCGSDYHGTVKPEIALGSEKRGGEYLDFSLNLFYKEATEGQTR